MSNQVTRGALRYFGGKWRIAQWIISQFPPHSCYVEPFMGGASVLLAKSPSTHEVANDLNEDVVCFFEILRSRPDDLIRAIQLTPYSRAELRNARKKTDDPLERARRLYVRCWQSYGSGVGTSSTGWRTQKSDSSDADAVALWNKTDHLWAIVKRLKQVQIESAEATLCIKRFDSPSTLFYVDPPYVHATRYNNSPSTGYLHEMSDADHRELAKLLNEVQGMVILSGYPCPLYDELYVGWENQSLQTRDVRSKARTECIWLSPKTVAAQTMPLFAWGDSHA